MMRVCFISDTHEFHRHRPIPACDLLIHAGDLTMIGERRHIEDFNAWILEQKAQKRIKHAIVVAGNHDFCFCPTKCSQEKIDEMLAVMSAPEVLNNTETEYGGLKIWGSPITPSFFPEHWGFNADRGEKIRQYWNQIPEGLDILITHGPPRGLLDQSSYVRGTDHLGCDDLLDAVKRTKPRIHVFGHIHGGYGISHWNEIPGTIFVNASLVNEAYKVTNAPVLFDLL